MNDSGEVAPLPQGFDRCSIAARHLAFGAATGVRHAFSLRRRDRSLPSLSECLIAADLPEWEPRELVQVHGDDVLLDDRPAAGGSAGPRQESTPRRADAHATREPGLVLVIRTADCVPVLLADPETGAVGAAHAGWKGTALEISARLSERMQSDLAATPGRLVAMLGPSIGPCCYVVGEDVAQVFRSRFPQDNGFVSQRDGRIFLDLSSANAASLRASGLPDSNIHASGLCTVCRNDLFPSYRKEGHGAGRIWSVIAARSSRSPSR